MLRISQVVEITGVNPQQITKMVKAGVLPIINPGGSKEFRGYYRKEDIERVFQIKL